MEAIVVALSDDGDRGALGSWMAGASRRGRGAGSDEVSGGVRFAFYGCTGGFDGDAPEVSEEWQREMAEHTIAGKGVIVAGFFDIAVTARVSWFDRPQASALRVAFGDPDRGFDAVVVGDYERAFGAVAQFRETVSLSGRHGLRVWMPEAGGVIPVDGRGFPALLTVLQSVVHSPAAWGGEVGRRRVGGQGGRRVRP
ncbi:hypothetical protein GCM10010492_70330 [Saccharothrix mutabilis subsp. mutabilis]|uniref:Uncharacterized protein n=1 Tax=Saccharothrix mutabilis subsp. mutabilis TaxID=66855 RepID=A0ABP3ECF7_9PSEU